MSLRSQSQGAARVLYNSPISGSDEDPDRPSFVVAGCLSLRQADILCRYCRPPKWRYGYYFCSMFRRQ